MKPILPALVCLLCTITSYAQYSPLKTSKDSINNINKAAILNDLDEYADGVAHNHVHPFTYIKKKEFYAGIQKIKDSADKYDTDQLLTRLLQVNALIQDEHTYIMYTGRDVFPLSCYWFDEGIFVTRTDKDNMQYLYSRIIAVNDVPIEEVTHRIATILPNKNIPALKLATPRYLFDPFVLHGLMIAPTRNNVVYTIVTYRKDTVKLSLTPVDRRTVALHSGFDKNTFIRAQKNAPYWHIYNDTGKYIYFKYTQCFDDKKYPFKEEITALKETIETRHPQKIIIDLRDNGGGHASLLVPFTDYLNRSDLNRKGGIYVLVGRKTFSAAILNSVYLRNQTYAQLVGEETSGDVAHFGFIKFFTLSETKLKVSYSTQYVETNESYEGSLRPDVIVSELFDDYSKGKDAVLNYAITH